MQMIIAVGTVRLWAGETARLAAAADAPAVRSIGTESQLLVDDVLLARKTGVIRKVHPCQKLPQPVLASEEPWEQDGPDQRVYVYGTVLRDGPEGPFRMWYNRNSLVLYATSNDGLSWERPRLGLCDFGGSKQNNIVFPLFHSPSVVYNPQAEDPDHRYNMLGCGRANGRGYYAAHSADGLHWNLYPRNPVLPSSDTCTLAFDPATGEYLAFHKRTHKYAGQSRRLVYLATSRDMQQWSEAKLVMAPDEIDDAQVRAEGGRFAQFYNMSVFPCGGQFLGLITHFRFTGPPPEKGPLQSGDDGPVDVQLVHSRNGRVWNRCEDRSPAIPNGPHAYDAGCILGVTNGPLTVGDQWWLYYTAITTTHGGYVPKKKITIALAKWRRDGLVSLGTEHAGGVIETVPLRCAGDHLVVNADAADGEVTVAVLNEHGRELPGYAATDCLPLRADAVRHAVRWQDHDRLDTANPIRLRFHLSQARLFSYAVLVQ